MRNDNNTDTLRVRKKRGWSRLALASLGGFSSGTYAMDNLEIILDGYAYAVNSDVSINLGQQTIVVDSDLDNCLLPNGQPPMNTVSLTLITNNQDIGIERFRYFVKSRLMFLTSETSNLVCDNGLFVDQIFAQGFEHTDLIFSHGFETN